MPLLLPGPDRVRDPVQDVSHRRVDGKHAREREVRPEHDVDVLLRQPLQDEVEREEHHAPEHGEEQRVAQCQGFVLVLVVRLVLERELATRALLALQLGAHTGRSAQGLVRAQHEGEERLAQERDVGHLHPQKVEVGVRSGGSVEGREMKVGGKGKVRGWETPEEVRRPRCECKERVSLMERSHDQHFSRGGGRVSVEVRHGEHRHVAWQAAVAISSLSVEICPCTPAFLPTPSRRTRTPLLTGILTRYMVDAENEVLGGYGEGVESKACPSR